MTALLTEAELEAIRKHAEADYPAEACGVLLVRPGAVEERRLRACRNIQDELHAKDPGRFPRTARTAYYIAHEDLLEIGRHPGAERVVELDVREGGDALDVGGAQA